MTFKEAYERLAAAGVPDALNDARILFRAFMPEGFFPPRPTDECHSEQFKLAIERRRTREPLQYILGSVPFCHEEYEITPAVLIPRQDTEILVEVAAKRLKRGAYIADLCTGSGCVGISTIASTCETKAVLADISADALTIAKKNADKNGVLNRCSFLEVDLLFKNPFEKRSFDAILSNPPYVTEASYNELEDEIYHEPRAAFVGGKDGLDFYRVLIPLAKEALKEDGFAAFEIGFDQRESVCKIADECGFNTEVFKDYGGSDRVVLLTFK